MKRGLKQGVGEPRGEFLLKHVGISASMKRGLKPSSSAIGMAVASVGISASMKRGLKLSSDLVARLGLHEVGISASMKRGLKLTIPLARERLRIPVGISASMKRRALHKRKLPEPRQILG